MINVVLNNESTGKLYKKVNTVLAKYFNQTGQKSFAGNISQEGLEDVYHELKSFVSKYMSVSCVEQGNKHNHNVLWILGNKDNFDPDTGVYAMKTKTINLAEGSYNKQEKYWLLITKLAALFHDVGKFNKDFQQKLRKNLEALKKEKNNSKDPINKVNFEFFRHEAVSAIVFNELLKSIKSKDGDFSLDEIKAEFEKAIIKTKETIAIGSSFKELSNNASFKLEEVYKNCEKLYEKKSKGNKLSPNKSKEDTFSLYEKSLVAVLYIVLTHHRLINTPENNEQYGVNNKSLVIFNQDYENISEHCNLSLKNINSVGDEKDCLEKIKNNFTFENDLIYQDEEKDFIATFTSSLNALKNICESEDINVEKKISSLSKEEYIALLTHYARTTMILADYVGSIQKSLKDSKIKKDNLNIANLEGLKEGDRVITHLKKVAIASKNIHKLRKLAIINKESFNRIENFQLRELNNSLLSGPSKFAWQNEAYRFIKEKTKLQPLGNLTMIISETGAGKTLGGAKIMYAIQKDHIRFTLGLGLRTLTLQSGQSYREMLHLNNKNLAVVLGSSLAQKIYAGSSVLEEDDDFILDVEDIEIKNSWTKNVKTKDDLNDISAINSNKIGRLVDTPVVVATVDQFIKVTNLARPSALKILPRVFSSDLILDEIDSYSPNDLVEVIKLIYFYAIYGRNVIVMSATVNSEILKSIQNAYKKGFNLFRKLNEEKNEAQCFLVSNLISPQITNNENEIDKYLNDFKEFQNSDEFKPKLKLANIIKTDVNKDWKLDIYKEAKSLHNLYKDNGVSVGFVKFNTVHRAREFAKYLLSEEDEVFETNDKFQISVLCYHSKFTFAELDNIEQELAKIINRKNEKKIIEKREDKIQELKEKLFGKKDSDSELMILISTTSILEVGRDHDYDFAILEPTTNKAFIQASGRVLRHRNVEEAQARVSVLEKPLKDSNDPFQVWRNYGIFNDLQRSEINKDKIGLTFTEMFSNVYVSKIVSSIMFEEAVNYMKYYEDKIFHIKLCDTSSIVYQYVNDSNTLTNLLYKNKFRNSEMKESIKLSLDQNITLERLKLLTFSKVYEVNKNNFKIAFAHRLDNKLFKVKEKRIFLKTYNIKDYVKKYKSFSNNELFELFTYDLKTFNKNVKLDYSQLLGFNDKEIIY